jgi:hypothetical protein
MVVSNTYCGVVFFGVGRHHTQEKRRRQIKQKTHHNMCWTTPYRRQKAKTNKAKNTTQYVLDTTMHKTKVEDKQNKTHNTICVGHQHTQDKRRRQTNTKKQHNMWWTTPYRRKKDEDKQKIQHRKLKKDEEHGPPGRNTCDREG